MSNVINMKAIRERQAPAKAEHYHLCRVCWKSTLTGFEGSGKRISRSLAEAWIKHARENELTCIYWISDV